MLRGTKILKGLIYFEVEENEFEEESLLNLMKMIRSIINDNFDFDEHRQNARFDAMYSSTCEPVMNEDELHTATFGLRDSVGFYSHSKNLGMEKLKSTLISRLERLLYPGQYSGLKIHFHYSMIVFSQTSPSIESLERNREIFEVTVDSDDFISIERELKTNQYSTDVSYDDIKEYTNLFIFSEKYYLGTIDMLDHLLSLDNDKEKMEWFNGFEDKNTKLVVKLLNNEMHTKKPTLDVEEELFHVIDSLADDTSEEYMIGTSQLIVYMEKVSSEILKYIMRYRV